MPHALDGPQVDTRPPLYGCGPSFGMLGPSRLIVLAGALPTGLEHYAGGWIVSHKTQGFGSPPWSAQWQGEFPELTVNVFLSWLTPATGLWRLNVDVNSGNPAYLGGATRLVTNFTWQFPGIPITEDTNTYDDMIIGRIAEWQTISEKFPLASFPDEL